jgi:hypothetical protein
MRDPVAGPKALLTRPGLASSETAGEEQYDKDNAEHSDDARGPITIRVIAPVGQPAEQKHKNDDQ